MIQTFKNFISETFKKFQKEKFEVTKGIYEKYDFGPGERISWLVKKKKLLDARPTDRDLRRDLAIAEARFYGTPDPRGPGFPSEILHSHSPHGSLAQQIPNYANVFDAKIIGKSAEGLYKIRVEYRNGIYADFTGFTAVQVIQLFEHLGKPIPNLPVLI